MGKFIITKEIIKNARDYLPLGNKELFAQVVAKKCVVPIVDEETLSKGIGDLAVPSSYREDYMTKQLCVMNLFLKYYLCVTEDDNAPFDAEKYDFYALSHIFNQLEKMKRETDVKDKVLDILADFKEFRKHIDNAIYQLLTEKNDTLGRLSTAIQLASDPEYMQKMIEQLQGAVAMLENDTGTEKEDGQE